MLAGNRKWCGVRWFPRFVFLFSSTSAWTTAFRFGFVFGSLDVALIIGHVRTPFFKDFFLVVERRLQATTKRPL